MALDTGQFAFHFHKPLTRHELAEKSAKWNPICYDSQVAVPLQACKKREEVVLSTNHKSNGHKPNGNGASTYKPISSVWEGTDGDLLEAMFNFYAVIPPEPILDATYNAGRFWKASSRRVVSMNIDPCAPSERLCS